MHKTFTEYVAQRDGTPVQEGLLWDSPFEKIVRSAPAFRWLISQHKLNPSEVLKALKQSYTRSYRVNADEMPKFEIMQKLAGEIKAITRGKVIVPEELEAGSAATPVGGRDALNTRVDAALGGNRFAK